MKLGLTQRNLPIQNLAQTEFHFEPDCFYQTDIISLKTYETMLL